MSESRFWRVMAVLGVAGLFYVGHGLNQQSAPIFVQKAQAQGVAVQPGAAGPIAVTASADGKTIYCFGPATAVTDFAFEKFLLRVIFKNI